MSASIGIRTRVRRVKTYDAWPSYTMEAFLPLAEFESAFHDWESWILDLTRWQGLDWSTRQDLHLHRGDLQSPASTFQPRVPFLLEALGGFEPPFGYLQGSCHVQTWPQCLYWCGMGDLNTRESLGRRWSWPLDESRTIFSIAFWRDIGELNPSHGIDGPTC